LSPDEQPSPALPKSEEKPTIVEARSKVPPIPVHSEPKTISQKYDEEPVKTVKLGRMVGYKLTFQGKLYHVVLDRAAERYDDASDGITRYNLYNAPAPGSTKRAVLRQQPVLLRFSVDHVTHEVTLTLPQ
jgi:hypothetical protein